MSDAFTVQISSNLINRLAGDVEKPKKRIRKLKPRIPHNSRESQKKIPEKQISNDSKTANGATPGGWPLWPHFSTPTSPPSQPTNAELEGIRSVLRESERVVEKLQKHENDILKEVTQRAKKLHEKEFKLPDQKPLRCVTEKDACLACYKEHVKDPLKCADAVRSFRDCARRVSQQATTQG